MPALNEERRIPPLLDALRSISIIPQNIELIVVDDGSTDSTSNICQQIIDVQQVHMIVHLCNKLATYLQIQFDNQPEHLFFG